MRIVLFFLLNVHSARSFFQPSESWCSRYIDEWCTNYLAHDVAVFVGFRERNLTEQITHLAACGALKEFPFCLNGAERICSYYDDKVTVCSIRKLTKFGCTPPGMLVVEEATKSECVSNSTKEAAFKEIVTSCEVNYKQHDCPIRDYRECALLKINKLCGWSFAVQFGLGLNIGWSCSGGGCNGFILYAVRAANIAVDRLKMLRP